VTVILTCGVAVTAQAAQLFVPLPELRATDMSPEHNQVLEYLKQLPTTKSVNLVRLNLDALQQPTVELNLRSDMSSTANMRKIDKRSDTQFTWYGQLADVPGDAILVVHGDAVEGTVRRGTALHKIQAVGGGVHAVVEVDTSKFPPEEPPSFREKERQRNRREPAARGARRPRSLTAQTPIIEVLVAYTNSAETAKGGANSISAMIQLAIDETNQSYQNSRINARLHLARVAKVDYDESTRTFETILSHFAGTNDGFMDEIHTLRNTHAADVAVLIINKTDYCGLADDIKANAATAFAIVHYDCATGYYSFGHEIGHLQGARHNTEADPSTAPFSYGHGFHNGSAWRTIMAYDCSPSCPRLQYWSNPDVGYNGVAMGTVATQNNARVLNTTAATVATFRNPDGTIWRYTGTPCSGNSCPGWQALDNNPKTVNIVAADSSLYQLHNDGMIWRYTGTPCSGGSCPGWQRLDNNPKTIAIVAAGTALYQLHNDGMIWRYTGTPCSGNSCPGWQRLDNNSKAKAIVAADSSLYQLHNDGMIWRYTGTPCSGNSCPGWQRLDNNPKTIAIVAAGTALYQLHNDGMIWRYTGTPCSGNSCPGWQQLDNNPKAKAIVAAASSLYQLHNDGMIWRYTGTPCSGNSCPGWQRLDNNPKTVGITAGGNALYQLHNDGMIWRYTGTPCSGNSCPGWQLFDNNPKTKEIDAAGTALYQLHGN
jgi:hypothetical protein